MPTTVYKVSNLFSITTAPTNPANATPHSGGWSEGFWMSQDPLPYAVALASLRQKRAALLPKQAAMIGFRVGVYTIDQNKLIPVGSSTGRLLLPGPSSRETDLPQVSLELSVTAVGGPNVSRPILRCIPDDQMKFGEYQPDGPFAGLVTQYRNAFGGNAPWGFIGRDLSFGAVRVKQIVAGVLTTFDPIPGFANGNFIRFIRVINDSKLPVKGAFSAVAGAGNTYTLSGYNGGEVTKPSGSCRKDAIRWFPNNAVTVSRGLVRKVGRPSQGYRGRRSRARA